MAGKPNKPLGVPGVVVTTVAVAGAATAAAFQNSTGQPTIEEAKAFVERADQELLALNVQLNRASWVQSNFITDDTQAIAADAISNFTMAVARLAKEAQRFSGLDLPPDIARRIMLLKLKVAAPPPPDPAEAKEMIDAQVAIESAYGEGKYCPPGQECKTLNDLEDVLRTSRDPKQLLDAWTGWRTVSPPMRAKYRRFVELSNKGARAMGFADTGALWRSNYDMDPDAFARELDRLWEQVKPLYTALHAHVRAKLIEKYGIEVVGDDGLIPAHLLGNMWSQAWSNIYPLVAPPSADPGYDLTELLVQRGFDAREMVRSGERFFTSLGFAPLPETFWERSLFTKPADREVICHASAWDVESPNDLRIKMCIKINDEDFITIHHELGHNFYQRAYGEQPWMYRDSANDGFHEALGDLIALSVTPEYLKQIGLLQQVPGPEGDLGLLMKMALDKVAFLPFGLLIDQWRWKVFSGEISPDEYNAAWWELCKKYQGIRPPTPRGEEFFDPGAKYHVPANVPYTRYFLAHVLQFQFFRALCEQAGASGPLHRCSFYGNTDVGRKINDMMAMGKSRPWPDALEALTGQREMDATAVLDYFAPLKKWLDEQNKGRKVGWES